MNKHDSSIMDRRRGLLQAALYYAQLGYAVFPLHAVRNWSCSCGKPGCDSPGKHPRTEHGWKDASTDPQQIREWWNEYPDANIGIAVPEGAVVLDVDPDTGGLQSVQGKHLPEDAPCARTGGGGYHYWFRLPDGVQARNGISVLPGVDIRTAGGHAVAPPSLHVSGERYEWEAELRPVQELPVAPEWLVELLRRAYRTKRNRHRDDVAVTQSARLDLDALKRCALEHWQNGQRHDLALTLAGALRKSGVAQEDAERVIGEICVMAGDAEVADRLRAVADTYAKPLEEVAGFSRLPEALQRMFYRGNGDDENPLQTGLPLADSILRALRRKHGLRNVLWNEARACVEIVLIQNGTETHRELSDLDIARFSFTPVETGRDKRGEPITRDRWGRDIIEDALYAAAEKHRYHPIIDWLRSLQWDGQDRIRQVAQCIQHRLPPLPDGSDPVERFLTKWLVGAVIKAIDQSLPETSRQNFVLCLSGPQGIGKSSFAAWLSPRREWFSDDTLDVQNKDHLLRLAQLLVVELGEMGHITSRQDVDALKRLVSATTARVRPPYGRREMTLRLTASLIGTSNPGGALLFDRTGNRRFVILRVDDIDLDRLYQIDVAQVWAQAVALYTTGYSHQITQHETEWQTRENEQFEARHDDPVVWRIDYLLGVVHNLCNIRGNRWSDNVSVFGFTATDDGEYCPVHCSDGELRIPVAELTRAVAESMGERESTIASRVRAEMTRRGFIRKPVRLHGNDAPVKCWTIHVSALAQE